MSLDFDALFDAWYVPLRRYCHRLTGDPDAGDDAAQEAFLRCLERQPTGSPAGLRAWLFTVATHLIRDRVRVGTNRRRLLERNPVVPWGPLQPDAELDRSERVATVRRALAGLKPRDRELLLLREEGLSYRELADVLGVAPASVGTLLVRARSRFARAIQEEVGWDEAPE